MASLQDRLQKAFGALGGAAEAPAWCPTSTQVFRAGGREEAGNSSDEEYEERQRREAVPGLAQSLAEEDEPNEEGFRPSTAFCRALDAEEEYNEVDEMATGLLARRAGADLLPPLDTQVLEDNVYEQRSRRAVLGPGADDSAEEQLVGEQMELEGEALPGVGAAGPSAAAAAQQQQQQQQQPLERQVAAGPSRSSLAAASGGASPKERKKVQFEGVAQPWVPPARRPGYQQRCTDLPPCEGGAPQPRQQRGQGLSVVPDHVKNPEKYTCYVLDEPLVVGGGVGQLSSAQQEHGLPSAAAAGGDEAAQPEPERWQGGAGRGVVQFQPRQQRTGGSAGEGAAGGAKPAGGSGAPAQRQGPHLAFGEEEEGAEEAPGDGEGADEPMTEAGAAQQQPRGKRHYRSSRAAAADAD